MHADLPDKLYFKIGEVAKLADVAPHVIRYWESEFKSIQPKRANSKQRLFRREDVIEILTIKDLLHHQGFTIAGAKKVLLSGRDGIINDPVKNGTSEKPNKQKTSHEHGIDKLQAIKKELVLIKEILD